MNSSGQASSSHVKLEPPLLPPVSPVLTPPTHHALLPLFQLAQTLHLLQHMLEKILAAHDIEMALNLGVFLCEAVDFFLRKTAA